MFFQHNMQEMTSQFHQYYMQEKTLIIILTLYTNDLLYKEY